jgi:hypothetical protein
MKPIMLVGIVLIVVGLLALAYQGITYTTREKVVQVGPVQVTTEKREVDAVSTHYRSAGSGKRACACARRRQAVLTR